MERRVRLGSAIRWLMFSCIMTLPCLTACGGGGTTTGGTTQVAAAAPAVPSVATPTPDPTKPVRVDLQFTPQDQTQKAAVLKRTLSDVRRTQYVSTANTRITVGVTPFGGGTTTYGPTACTTATCNVSFTATPGPTTLVFTLTDNSANVLSQFTTVVVVQPTTLNTLRFSANPVVNSVSLTLAAPTVNAGTPNNDLLTIAAKDISGATIVGKDAYVDANGTPVTIYLNVANNQAGGTGSVSIIGSARIASPAQTPIYARYDGRWLQSSTIGVATNSPLITSLTGTTLTTNPYATVYAASGGPTSIVSGPDGNLWYTAFSGNAIGKMTTAGVLTTYACSPCNAPYDITAGADGNLWFGEYNGQSIGKISVSGAFQRLVSTTSTVVNVALGPDGNIWFSQDSVATIGAVSPTGTVKYYSVPTPNQGLGFGINGTLWTVAASNGTTLSNVNRIGKLLGSYTIPATGSFSAGVTVGSDGNVWFGNYGSGLVERVTQSGVVTPFALTSGAAPQDVATGPDGYIWATERGRNALARISPSGVVTEYGAANNVSASNPIGITEGPDGNMWIANFGANTVTKFVL